MSKRGEIGPWNWGSLHVFQWEGHLGWWDLRPALKISLFWISQQLNEFMREGGVFFSYQTLKFFFSDFAVGKKAWGREFFFSCLPVGQKFRYIGNVGNVVWFPLVSVENNEKATTRRFWQRHFATFHPECSNHFSLDETQSLHVSRLIEYFRKMTWRVW